MSTVWCAGSGLVVVLLVSVRTVSLSAESLIGPNVGQGEGVVPGMLACHPSIFDLLRCGAS